MIKCFFPSERRVDTNLPQLESLLVSFYLQQRVFLPITSGFFLSSFSPWFLFPNGCYISFKNVTLFLFLEKILVQRKCQSFHTRDDRHQLSSLLVLHMMFLCISVYDKRMFEIKENRQVYRSLELKLYLCVHVCQNSSKTQDLYTYYIVRLLPYIQNKILRII